MTRRVIIDPEADRDIEEQFDYLADRNIDAALRFLQATSDTFELLATMPGMGAPRRYNNPRLAGVRMAPIQGFKNYLAFYLTTEDSIQVLRVLHGARNIEEIFEQS